MKEYYTDAAVSRNESLRVSYARLIDKSELSVDGDSNWLITLSDILSLLLIFFIMFLIMTNNAKSSKNIPDQGNQHHVLPARGPIKEAFTAGNSIKDEIDFGIRHLNLGDEVSVSATEREVIITMKERVTFRPGEAEILGSFRPVLDNIADILQKYAYYLVEINGHTDDVPIKTSLYPSNWELSVSRATSVLKYFMNEHDVNPSRLSVKGHADQSPVVPNSSPENRARNRRVEIKLRKIEA